MGRRFQGVYDRHHKRVHLFQHSFHGAKKLETDVVEATDPRLPELIGEDPYKQLRDELELLDAAGTEFTPEAVLASTITPVYFGSALTNFGVEPFLQSFLEVAPEPAAYKNHGEPLPPDSPMFSGFVFKIQANMDPLHRDRVAFLRICSGRFERGMPVRHQRLEKEIRLTKPMQFMAQERSVVDEAFAGDIIGLFDTGILRIGDTLTDGKRIKFEEVPHFSPEHFARLRIKDPLKRKQLKKGLDQLSEEGAIQVFYQVGRGEMDPIVGAVGQLQFEVMQYRLEAEYGAPTILEKLAYDIARWVEGEGYDPKLFASRDRAACVEDRDGHPMVLFKGDWSLRHAMNDFPKLKFMMTGRA
jgi:peptide chain release factor 3